ncbi:deoxyribodipyrimidine photo-lyase [Methanonatronarchaeum sp. AMET6-2]|uniref:cryptochrome/photolyase family protein n=1 Tax=Methanonatronarchaeum sp. AMET6-2 TaxID=2933293 RepID=UPI001225483A|nr:deoxyribodipyrimidine photo-lyase [Methanonatronarchaeum sp. AMET6-2]RZN63216.1 MAG: deoxyribodipyrimidine photo-lyase [Methanonatronarchaeia archaeon]UOY10525.1 DNA photolyase family protein [Methanonatronarchaeum sp. AMET6-2]
MTSIFLFRRDLRLHDNLGLSKAIVGSDEVIPVYVVDKNLFSGENKPGFKRAFFWLNSLRELAGEIEEFGGSLTVRSGEPVEILSDLIGKHGVDALYLNRDYTPYARKRDKAIKELDVDYRGFKDHVLHEKNEILTGSGTPYKVFSYYYKKWREMDKRKPFLDTDFNFTDYGLNEIPSLSDLGYQDGSDVFLRGGRDEAVELLDNFKDKVDVYHEKRDKPAENGTSRLSPHLKFGTISVREAYWIKKVDSDGLNAWRRQLAWRDFYFQQLWSWPEIQNKAGQEKYRGIDWIERPGEWEALKEGNTGFPFIDAGIRQLRKTGWMHNRPRMAVAGFAAKDLHLDWHLLDRYFKKMFVDFERPSMTGGIQWSYSIGIHSQPYFNIFNPTQQGEKHDPDGKYIRKYIPELREVPDRYIHKPGEMPLDIQEESDCILGQDYPEPILNHSQRRKKAIELYEKQ